MFYSNTYLGKKGPLGTVWLAAFLQHKLRKSHVVVIDIPSSVERIMLPEVPIALRLSGHLLVGVVRIYSRKVDYLYHDCNEVLTQLRTAFASIQINLPEGATHAPFNLITRPETFELDAVNMDGLSDFEQTPDKNTRPSKDITMEDPVSEERNPYIAILLEDEDDTSLQTGHFDNAGYRSMDIDTLPPFPGNFDIGLMGHDPVTHEREPENNVGDDRLFSNDIPEMEVLRDHVQPFETGHEVLDSLMVETGHEVLDSLMVDKRGSEAREESGKSFPSPQTNLAFEGEPFLERSIPSMGSADLPAFDLGAASGHATTELKLQPTPQAGEHVASELKLLPTPQVDNKKATTRKRKLLFDDSIVLTNDSIKKQLQGTSKLVRKRRSFPCTTLDAWKFHCMTSMDELFSKPSAMEMCTGLREAFKKSFSVGSAAVPTTEFSIEHGINEMYKDNENSNDLHGMEEIEHFRSHVDVSSAFMDVESFQPHPRMSPPRTNDITPLPIETTMSPTQLQEGIFPTPDLMFAESTANINGMFMDHSEGGNISLRGDSNFVVDTSKPADSDELNLAELEGGEELSDYSMSARTRAVARFLIKKSPATRSTGFQSGKLSLNKIMNGRTRNQCARILFETLVLKSNQLIDVEQEEAYGDITLLLNPKVLNEQL